MKQYAIYFPNSPEIFKTILGELVVYPSGVVAIINCSVILAVVPKEYLVLEIDKD